MFKRLVILAVFAALTALLGPGSDAVFANEGNSAWLTDGSIQGDAWQGLPDNLERTAKFVVLDGPANNGLGQFSSLGQMTTLTLTFDRAPEDDCVRVALFDPNTIGRWDQRVDMQLVDKAPDVVYEVFKPTNDEGVCTDLLLFDANPLNDPAPVLVTSAYKDYNKVDAGNAALVDDDDKWVGLVDLTTAQAEALGLKLDDGRFRLVFRARLRPAPRNIEFGENHDPLTVQRDISSFTGRERAGYKIAFNGTYLVPAGGVLGFAGGIIDERVRCAGAPSVGCAETEDDVDAETGVSDPVLQVDPTLPFDQKDDGSSYFYDGVFNFHVHSTHACEGDVEFSDADADWVDVANLTVNDFDANGFLTGPKLTGIPPENVGRYIRPNDLLCDGKREIGGPVSCADRDRLVGFDLDPIKNADGVIKWSVFPVAGYPGHNTDPLDPSLVPTFSSDDTVGGRASYTAAQEPGGPFRRNDLDQATLQADPGLWCLQWQGVDCANFVFMRFNVPVGTTPRPKLAVEVFCSTDCERDDDDTPLPLNGGVVNLKLTEVDCDTEEDVLGGHVLKVSTGADGVWNSPDCPALLPVCYRIEFDGDAPLKPAPDCLDLPLVVNLTSDAEENQCIRIELPRDCRGMLDGHVYCEQVEGCSYDAGTDLPLPSGAKIRIIATPMGPMGMGTPVETEVTGPATDWMIDGLEFGTYVVSYQWLTDPIPLWPDCTPTRMVEITAEKTRVSDIDFGFDCAGGSICGDVYCENSRDPDCTYDDGVQDGPLPAGTKYVVTLTPVMNNVPVPGDAQTLTLTAPVTRYCFEDLDFGDYEITVSNAPGALPNEMLPPLHPQCEDKKDVSVTRQVPDVDDCDFGFDCLVDICGNVYCEETENCKYDAGTPDRPLPDGTEVEVTLRDAQGKALDTRIVTAPDTGYCFEDLADGTYKLTFAFLVGTPLDLAPACKEEKTVVLASATGSVRDCDFGFVCDGRLFGYVFCDYNLNQRRDVPPDKAPMSATVEAQLIPESGPLPPALTQDVDPDGFFDFDNITPGKYVVKVTAIDPAAWTPLFNNVTGIEVTVPAGGEEQVLLPYDCRLCEIHGTVYCDDDLSGSLTLGDLRFAGVEVTATGPGGIKKVATNAQGEYAFLELAPGLWVITVDPNQPPYNTVPPRPTAPAPVLYELDCERGDMVMDKDFRSLCLGRIYGYVFQDPLGDCDGIWQDTDVPVDGARIRLTGPGILPAPNPRETTTNADGFYQFGDLPRGTYKVEILDPLPGKWVVLGLAHATPREVPGIVLPRLGEERVDFGFCVQKLRGIVFQDDPRQDCDGVYQAGDIPVDGATIRLTGPANLPAPNPRTTVSNANGEYEFPDLVPGDYTVEILSPLPAKWEAINLTLVEGVTPKVQNASLDIGEIERIDFGHCTQSLSGKVFKQPFGYWDGVWNPSRDTPLEGVLVELKGTAGAALNYTDSTRTNVDGDYFFDNVPTGAYEIRLSDSDAQTIAILTGLIDDGQKVLTPTVDVGDRIPDLDFPKCECEQELCVNVFREEAPACDGEFDEGVDKLAEFIKVRFEQLSTGRNTTLMTDADGRICLPILEPGDYKVSINPRQPELVDCRPSDNTALERIVSFDPKECANQELWFGFCCCTKMGCCEGKLHEVVLETRFWQCDPRYEAVARMYMDCGGDDLVDEAEAKLVDKDFASVPGAAGVVKIESIKHDGPLVTVRVRLTATGTRFPGRSFGNAKHLVTVTLNGETNQICEVFRAEVMRPGSVIGCRVWDKELERWVLVRWPCEEGVSYREVDWDAYECGNLCWKFGVVEIWCFKDWCRCNCDCPTPECQPCKGRVTQLTLRYDGKKEIHGVVIQQDDGRLLFDAPIKPGDVIKLTGKGDDGTMGSVVKLFTNDVCLPIKTDCNKLLRIGASLGGFTIIGGASSEGGPFCDPRVIRDRIRPACRECCKPEKPCDCKAGVTHLALAYLAKQPKWVVILQSFDGRLLFEGMVHPGDVIRVRAAGDDGTMGTTIKLLTNEFCGELDVTCRKPIGIGTKSGPFVVVGGASRDGGRFCGSPTCKECPDDPGPKPCPNCPQGAPEDD